jgi:hypothetical protein
MRISRTSIGCHVRRFSVALLALWLSGAGCLFCCGRDLPEASMFESAAAANQIAVASASAAHSCCTARVKPRADKGSQHSNAASRFVGHERRAGGGIGSAAACCERTAQVSAQARKQRVLFAPATNSAPAPSLHSLTHTLSAQASSFRDHNANLRETHLRCCVFLI